MIAITGAAGFIGSNLVHRLSAAGHQVCLVDHPFTAAKARNWVGLPSFHYLTDALFLDALKAGSLPIEVIFHLGACSSTTETDWEYLLRNNIGYTQSLWNWCAEAKKPFYYASSAATYGDGAKGFDDRTSPSELQPLNLYGKSKNDFDLWALGQVSEGKAMPPSWVPMRGSPLSSCLRLITPSAPLSCTRMMKGRFSRTQVCSSAIAIMKLPSPVKAITGRSGYASRAAMAAGTENPMVAMPFETR